MNIPTCCTQNQQICTSQNQNVNNKAINHSVSKTNYKRTRLQCMLSADHLSPGREWKGKEGDALDAFSKLLFLFSSSFLGFAFSRLSIFASLPPLFSAGKSSSDVFFFKQHRLKPILLLACFLINQPI